MTPPAATASHHLPPSLAVRTLRVCLWALAGVWVILVVAWLALFWIILPHINEWRGALETQATRALGMPVRLGAIQVRSSGWVPALRLDDVRLLDAQGREALHLQAVDVALSPASLWAFQPRLAQLHVRGLALDVRRDAQGQLHVGGHRLGQADPAFTQRVLDWVFRQGELVLRDGRVRWTDELRPQAPPLQLQAVQLVIRNSLRRHDIRLDAAPPPGWGQPFSLRGRFTQPLLARPGDWPRWQGEAYAEFPQAQVASLGRYLPLPVKLHQGEGAVRVWTQWQGGRPRQATVDVALAALRLQWGTALQPLSVQQLRTRLELAHRSEGWQAATRGLQFRTVDGLAWPAGDLALTLRQAQDGLAWWPTGDGVLGGEFSAERLDLKLLSRAAGRLPLPEAWRTALAQWSPQGLAQGVSLRWEGRLQAPVRYQARARLAGLGWAAGPADHGPGRPGLSNAQLELQATEAGGSALVAVVNGQLLMPGLWAEPAVPLRQARAALQWRRLGAPGAGPAAGLELQVRDARFTTGDDLQGQFQATWRRSQPGPGQIDLQGSVAQAPAPRVARYLPLALPEAVRGYVQRAVQGGRVSDVQFLVRGPLQAFPFQGPRAALGELRIAAQVQGVGFDYLPGVPGGAPSPWPALEDVHGELLLAGGELALRGARARLHGVAFESLEARLGPLAAAPELVLHGQGRGPAARLLSFIESSPLGGWLEHATAGMQADGAAELGLELRVPVHDPGHTRVKGEVRLGGNGLLLQPGLPRLQAARGRLLFTEEVLRVVDGQAQVLGGELRLGGEVRAGLAQFSGEGRASAAALRTQAHWPELAQAARLAEGEAAYQLAWRQAAGRRSFTLNTGLQGMALALPAPLGKAAAEAWPSELRLQWEAPSGATAASPLSLQAHLGAVAQAQAQWGGSGTQPTLLRAGVGLLTAAPQPPAGMHVAAHLPGVDLDEWQAWGARWLPQAQADSAAPMALPDSIALELGELRAGPRRLTRLSASLSPQAQGGQTVWRARLQADELAGQLEYRTARGEQPGRLMARLSRLNLPPAQAPAPPQELVRVAERTAERAPALDIEVDALQWQGRELGALKVLAHHEAGAAPAWVLDRFSLAVPEARLRAQGRWRYGTGERPMQADVVLDLDDSGALAGRLGLPQALTGGKGQLAGQLAWAGSPLAPDLGSLQGELKVGLAQGQVLKVEPGMARLLGVFSLQSLPRRLLGDFRDLTEDGFAFDRVEGDFQLDAGRVRTRNLRMQGLQATALVQGEADLRQETQALQVLVVPELNAGAASLAYAAVNPVVGLVSFAAQWLLRQPLMQASAREFRITGRWDDPQVERVERAPAAESAAPPASSPNANPNATPKATPKATP